ncbi:hypothetical protein Sxan_78780 [Streptomyces xanthophaeus]|uniref:Uncharacterized protein n=1 Tax=Streptomyces xanthophaeus TaxID=67385 RepID=A0A919LNC2_9ACTN|nr:hypothetical protein Sxan_78780 [Streptomyces xanthophaeus]
MPNPKSRKEALRYRLSRWLYGEQVPLPTPQEMQEALAHLGHSADGHSSPDGHAKIGRQGSAEERQPEQELH